MNATRSASRLTIEQSTREYVTNHWRPFELCSPLKAIGLEPNCFASDPKWPGADAGGYPARLRIDVSQNEDVAMKNSDVPSRLQSRAFAHPRDVVDDSDLTIKRGGRR
jgi:hypothetical protein